MRSRSARAFLEGRLPVIVLSLNAVGLIFTLIVSAVPGVGALIFPSVWPKDLGNFATSFVGFPWAALITFGSIPL